MLSFKTDVRVRVFRAQLVPVFAAACEWSAQHGVDVQVASVNDPAPNRVADSLHPFDLAVDCDPVNDRPDDRQSLADYFRRVLPAGYDVVFESNHVHVEWDTHRPPLMMRPA